MENSINLRFHYNICQTQINFILFFITLILKSIFLPHAIRNTIHKRPFKKQGLISDNGTIYVRIKRMFLYLKKSICSTIFRYLGECFGVNKMKQSCFQTLIMNMIA